MSTTPNSVPTSTPMLRLRTLTPQLLLSLIGNAKPKKIRLTHHSLNSSLSPLEILKDSLQKLDITSNNLSTALGLSNMSSLLTLIATDNPIRTFVNLQLPKSLMNLHLSSNVDPSSVADLATMCPDLKVLTISNWKQPDIDMAKAAIPNLEVINLTDPTLGHSIESLQSVLSANSVDFSLDDSDDLDLSATNTSVFESGEFNFKDLLTVKPDTDVNETTVDTSTVQDSTDSTINSTDSQQHQQLTPSKHPLIKALSSPEASAFALDPNDVELQIEVPSPTRMAPLDTLTPDLTVLEGERLLKTTDESFEDDGEPYLSDVGVGVQVQVSQSSQSQTSPPSSPTPTPLPKPEMFSVSVGTDLMLQDPPPTPQNPTPKPIMVNANVGTT
ncbi:hypothetical protein TrLO_g8369, partial [Triparma laevis f. longispina]